MTERLGATETIASGYFIAQLREARTDLPDRNQAQGRARDASWEERLALGEGHRTDLDQDFVQQVFAIHPGVVRTRLLESYGLELPEEWFVGPERAGALCARLASGRYDALSGRFLAIDDDLDELLKRADEITARELYTLRVQA
jgi:hypothetical protein